MLILSGDGYEPKSSIYTKLLHAAQTIITSMQEIKLEPVEPRNKEYSRFLMNYALDYDIDTPIDSKVGDAMSSLWKDESMNKLMEHRAEFRYSDSLF